MNDKLKYYIAFSQIQKIGPLKWQKITKYFANIEIAWQAEKDDFIRAGIEENIAEEIIVKRNTINPDQELEKTLNNNIKVLVFTDNEYPKLLKEINNPPYVLYYRGSLDYLNQFCLAVVGTRKYSSYGQQVTEDIIRQLSQHNITIVSGLALGIDSLAHETTLKNNGQTVAVLGSGLDDKNIYPSTNRYLSKKIIESDGAIISEYPIGTQPAKFTFPMRNRIVSGLSLGTLVIEAPASSGALITAKYALEQNRDVFAVPGSIYNNNSGGTNDLIKQGAKMVTSVEDILEELNLQQIIDFTLSRKIIPESEEEKIILEILSKEPIHIDKIAISSKLKINVLSGILTIMEMKGTIKDLGGKNYILSR